MEKPGLSFTRYIAPAVQELCARVNVRLKVLDKTDHLVNFHEPGRGYSSANDHRSLMKEYQHFVPSSSMLREKRGRQ